MQFIPVKIQNKQTKTFLCIFKNKIRKYLLSLQAYIGKKHYDRLLNTPLISGYRQRREMTLLSLPLNKIIPIGFHRPLSKVPYT